MVITSIRSVSTAAALIAGLAFATAASAEPRWGEGAPIGTGLAVGADVAAATAASPYYGYYDYAPSPFYSTPAYDLTPGWWNGWYGQPYPPGCGAGRPHC